MKRIIVHWTAGTYQPNNLEYNHYHFLINGDGVIIRGKHAVEDNENCNDGNYAAHTGGGNTGSIGIAMCGMYNFAFGKSNSTHYPLTAKQCERCFKLIAELSKQYKIPITSSTVMTHYEFGLKNPNTSSVGKIDIIYLPPFPYLTKEKIGDFIRNKARWYLNLL